MSCMVALATQRCFFYCRLNLVTPTSIPLSHRKEFIGELSLSQSAHQRQRRDTRDATARLLSRQILV